MTNEAAIRIRGDVPLLPGNPDRGCESAPDRPARRAAARRSAGTERRAPAALGGSGAPGVALPEIGRGGTHTRRCVVETFRRGAAPGEGRADHEAHARFRSRLIRGFGIRAFEFGP